MKPRTRISAPLACLFACLALAVCPAFARSPASTAGEGQAESPQASRAEMQTMQIPSHGARLNALMYVAAGAGPHPTVVLLHGFPGNERNLDLAQDIRRAGWNVLYFNYRGAWGTPGEFSFANSIEDTASAIAYLRRPEVAGQLRVDPRRIVLIGHSMGGFMAVQGAASDPAITAFATISAADMAGFTRLLLSQKSREEAVAETAAGLAAEGMAPLAGCTPEGLANELSMHTAGWPFMDQVDALKDRNALVITSDDGLAPSNAGFVAALMQAGDTHVTAMHLATDHAYSDKRSELSRAVLDWLSTLR
jgi:pimeloyl-ACP methyl ester carboxylesterase